MAKSISFNFNRMQSKARSKFNVLNKINHDLDHGNATAKAHARKGRAAIIARDTDGCFDKPTLNMYDGSWNPQRKHIVNAKCK